MKKLFKRSSQRAFTLLEITLTLALLGVLFGLTTVGLRGSIQKEGPRGLAHSLAGELRAARAEAQRSGQLVAVCFPSDRKTNSLSRSVYIRRGAQRGKVWKRLNFEREFLATIFLGTWPSATLASDALPPGWSSSTSDEVAIVFRPDGTAICNDIPAINDSVPIVVAQAMQGDFSGPSGRLSGALHPQTIWVSKSGTVRVNSDKAPLDTLPRAGTSELAVAQLKPEVLASSTPRITSANLFPKVIDPDQGSGIGQTLVQLHPYQKHGSQVEYGLASIEVSATDDDGGPLAYKLISEASGGSGGAGAFSVPNQEGIMKYSRDPRDGQYRWRALVSWRPPPGAPAGTSYNLKFVVSDPEGNTAEASAATNLLPTIESLIPSRIVMETTTRKLYLTNLDGAGQVWVNPKEGEYFPFFGRDGSKLYSFFDRPGNRAELRSRPANGTRFLTRWPHWMGVPPMLGLTLPINSPWWRARRRCKTSLGLTSTRSRIAAGASMEPVAGLPIA